jgi:hypothetical protein
MKLINFIIWLSAGAVIGWFASRMVKWEKPQTVKGFVQETDEK